jgi:polyhydroxyalkanoate synthase
MSLSPESSKSAWMDWIWHLAISPGKQMTLANLALEHFRELANPTKSDSQDAGSTPKDRRFAGPQWEQWPFNAYRQAYLLGERWWDQATHGVRGVERHHEALVAYNARRALEALSPANLLYTNPIALDATLQEGGRNLVRGALNLLEDVERQASEAPPAGTEAFVVGRDVGITPGKVVMRNRLAELIQYAPAGDKVHPEPVLIVPAWIMKYYILDLSPANSLIKYLVEQGHTVFCVSWKNPTQDDRNLGMDEYLDLGFFAALDAVNAIVPRRKVHATGYCIGGTLLSIAVAAMARDGDDRLASMTLFGAQTDFSEPGELGLFIDESQVSLLEAQMAENGYLHSDQMAGAFLMLRAYDLVWSRMVDEYLLGKRRPMFDLMAWNADGTRMPARMHSQYLRRLYLDNDLSEGRYPVRGKPVALGDIALPVFAVGTVTDHVAPWRSVYKIDLLLPGEITFALTNGGHNAGIVNPPGNPRRYHQLLTRSAGAPRIEAEDWLERAPRVEGSWWPSWVNWLKARSSPSATPPQMGAAGKGYPPLGDAPGTYVLEK